MGLFHKLSKIVSKASRIGDPVSAILRDKGGALGTVGAIINPGAAAADKFAAGAPINARNMLDPNGWLTPQPLPPEAPPQQLPPLPGLGSGTLPPALQHRPVTYSQPPPNAGLLTQLAYRMAGMPPGGYGPAGGPPVMGDPGNANNMIQLPPQPSQVSAQGLPMTDPYALLRWRPM